MLRQFSTRRIIGLFVFDWLGTLGMLLLAAFLRRELGELPEPLVSMANSLDVTLGGARPAAGVDFILSLAPGVFLLVAILWPFFSVVFAVYDARKSATLGLELRCVLLAVGVSTLALAGSLFFSYRETSRLLVILFFLLDLGLLLGIRVVLRVLSRNGQVVSKSRSVLILGAGKVGLRAVEQLQRYAWTDLQLVGFADDDQTKQGLRVAGLPVLGTLDQLPEIVQRHGVRDALVALPLRSYERLIEACAMLQEQSVHVHVIPDLFALSFPSATLDGFGGIPVIDLGQPGIHGVSRASKRAFDLVATVLLLVLLSPLLLAVSVLIKLESKGPVIYRQVRIGEGGHPFTMFKFRSMRAGADPAAHRAHVARLIEQNLRPDQLGAESNGSLKMDNDPRITRVGRVIRKFSIDELPQFINVLRGEMSVVGPRPPLPYEVELYQPWHRRRLETPPGVTGLWQVKGRNQVSFDEMVRIDLYYAEHRSFWLDLRIVLMTPLAAISGKGAG